MIERSSRLGWLGFAVFVSLLPASARADITQTASIPLTHTDWNTSAGIPGVAPLTFQQFDGPASKLKEVDLTVTYQTKNLFTMTFVTPSTISISANVSPTNPSQGFPIVTVGNNWSLSSFKPTFSVTPGSALAQQLTVSRTYGLPGQSLPQSFGFNQPQGSPFYIAPVTASTTFNQALTSQNSDFSQFLGNGTISFPFAAFGVSTFSSSSGNGLGSVETQGGVSMTVDYVIVPEPTSLVLLGLGGASLLLIRRFRRPGASLRG